MKIAVVGDNASMRMGGEAQKPYRFFTGYRRLGHDCRLIVHARCRDELRDLLDAEAFADVVFIEDTRLQLLIHRLSRAVPKLVPTPVAGRAISLLFQRQARQRLRRMQGAERFDIVHQPIPISPSLPSLIHGIGCPVVCGSMATNPGWPAPFHGTSERIRHWLSRPFWHLARAANRLLPGKRRARLLVADNEATARVLKWLVGEQAKVEIILLNAAEDFWFGLENNADPEDPRFVYVGRLVDWKCVDLLLEAVARLSRPVTLTIVGDGPERASLEARATALGLDRVEFPGWLGHREIGEIYSRATAGVSLSLKEAGGTSIMETMAAGVPVVTTAWGGHTSRMIPEAGALIVPESREQVIADAAEALERLMQDEAHRRACGDAGRAHARRTFRWPDIQQRFADLFAGIAG